MEEGQFSFPLQMATQPSQVTDEAQLVKSVHNSVMAPFGQTLSQSLTIKLNLNNYHVWKALILPAIKGNKFDGVLLRTEKCPAPLDPETGLPNPRYETWITIDQMLLSWILNPLSEDVMLQVIDSDISANEAWNIIADLCRAHNRAKIQQCRTAIQTTRKGVHCGFLMKIGDGLKQWGIMRVTQTNF
ncbi:hypothetical protein Scep_019505 [Stephania cephalantha]|uniref:Retrotransposon Copia-like N-terminal domain-containing protein n=1 Tax=Stephania cephalantha TaxID=152367 RepID=A0AAP0NPW0_9MAGN